MQRTKAPQIIAGMIGFACGFASLAALGCGGPANVQLPVFKTRGTVQYQGKALTGALIVFHPANASMKLPASPRAIVGDNGDYVLSTYAKDDGAPAGDYAITVELRKTVQVGDGETSPGKNELPARYADPKTSGLRATIAALSDGANELPPFVLTR